MPDQIFLNCRASQIKGDPVSSGCLTEKQPRLLQGVYLQKEEHRPHATTHWLSQTWWMDHAGSKHSSQWEGTAAGPDPAQVVEVDVSASPLLHLPQRRYPKVNAGRSVLTPSQHSSESLCIYIHIYIHAYALLFLHQKSGIYFLFILWSHTVTSHSRYPEFKDKLRLSSLYVSI